VVISNTCSFLFLVYQSKPVRIFVKDKDCIKGALASSFFYFIYTRMYLSVYLLCTRDQKMLSDKKSCLFYDLSSLSSLLKFFLRECCEVPRLLLLKTGLVDSRSISRRDWSIPDVFNVLHFMRSGPTIGQPAFSFFCTIGRGLVISMSNRARAGHLNVQSGEGWSSQCPIGRGLVISMS